MEQDLPILQKILGEKMVNVALQQLASEFRIPALVRPSVTATVTDQTLELFSGFQANPEPVNIV